MDAHVPHALSRAFDDYGLGIGVAQGSCDGLLAAIHIWLHSHWLPDRKPLWVMWRHTGLGGWFQAICARNGILRIHIAAGSMADALDIRFPVDKVFEFRQK